MNRHSEELRRRIIEDVEDLAGLGLETDRRDQDEPGERAGAHRGHLGRGPAADRMTQEVRLAELRRLDEPEVEPGEIVDRTGRVVGRHDGIVRFTVGQRRGLALGGREGTDNDPLYVVRLEPETRRVVVGPRSALGRNEIALYDVNWLGPVSDEEGRQPSPLLAAAYHDGRQPDCQAFARQERELEPRGG